jgi:two-component system sensor histidine kinase KdpD
MKSALLDAVTHDLRTPLTSIKAAATTLMESGIDLGDESRRDLLAIIDEETDRLNKFIGGLVDLARIEAGELETKRSDVPVMDIISRAVQRAEPLLTSRTVVMNVLPGVPDVRADGYSAEEVLYSLVENAAKYSSEGTDIRICAVPAPKGVVEITVEDKGRGIASSDRERIFEKFVRVSDSDIHSTADGLGLGLAIARGLAESQGGSLSVREGRDGYVTAFVLSLPAVDRTVTNGI